MKVLPVRAFGAAFLLTAACTTTETVQPQDQSFYSGVSSEVRAAAERALQEALETKVSGEEVSWMTPSRERGILKPVETWRSTSGHWCRRFTEIAMFANTPDRSRTAVACRVDGRWQLTEEA